MADSQTEIFDISFWYLHWGFCGSSYLILEGKQQEQIFKITHAKIIRCKELLQFIIDTFFQLVVSNLPSCSVVV